jgi:ketosteroid isomerase-like protein
MCSSNIELIAQRYKTVNPELLDEQIVWEKAENFLGGGVAKGRDAIFSEVFASIREAFQPWSAIVEAMFDGGDNETVIVLGRYMGKALATGKDISAPFAHIWRVREGKIVFARQYTDTFGIAKAQGLL